MAEMEINGVIEAELEWTPLGARGTGIKSVVKTSSDGLIDTYTITFTDGYTTEFQVKNGEKGEPGKDFKYEDFTPEQLKELTGPQGDAFTYEDFTQEQLEALRGQAGRDGTDGRDGRDGKDGVSPQVNVQPIDGGYQVIISTETSREVIDLMHGQNGQDGKDGAEGYTPQKNVDYFDGKDGQDGKSGVYVGSGEMPEGYNVQIDPGGEIEPFPAAVAVDALPEATKDRRGSFALVSEGNTDKLYICMMVAGAYSWFPVGSTSGGDTEDDTATTSILGQAVLGTMILGG